MRNVMLCLAVVAVIVTAGCKRLETKAAIQEAIDAHLKQRADLMMSGMTSDVLDVQFHGDTADADVRFQSKQSAAMTVTIRYTLRKAGDHWEVVSSSQAHGGMGTNPHAMPPASATPTQPAPEASH
ncbi:MAG: hypothetical protein ACLQOO_15405 [Terriglobia bacterium]